MVGKGTPVDNGNKEYEGWYMLPRVIPEFRYP